MSLIIKKYVLGYMGTNCYFIIDEESGECAVVDPADEFESIKEKIESQHLTVKYIILTHAHFDHMLALEALRDYSGAKLCIHSLDNESLPDPDKTLMRQYAGCDEGIRKAEISLEDGDEIEIGREKIKVIHTPGHTPGSICLSFGDVLVSGDTLFREGIGRYDFYGGDYSLLMKSLKKISEIEGERKIYPGHGSPTTLSHEKNNNMALV